MFQLIYSKIINNNNIRVQVNTFFKLNLKVLYKIKKLKEKI